MTATAIPSSVSRLRLGVFYVFAGFLMLFVLAVFFFLSPVIYPLWVFKGWFEPFSLDIHQLHHIMGGAANWATVVPMALHLYRPKRNLAGLQLVILTFADIVIGGLINGSVGLWALYFVLPVVGMALLHPTRREILKLGRPDNRELLALVGLAAVPILIFVVGQINLDRVAGDQHADWHHYTSMSNIARVALWGGLLASFKTPGWRIPAWSAGFLIICLGMASALFPDQASSVGVMWGILAVIWGVAFIGASEWIRVRDR